MTKRSRRIIFYICVLLFVAVSYVAILYALGYKYSFDDQRFFRTGAITITVNTSAQVYINDQLTDSTSLLTNTAGLDGLLPGVYSVRIQKDAFSVWQKNITVYESLVTDFPNVLLVSTDEQGSQELEDEIVATFTEQASQSSEFVIQQRILYRIVDEKKEKIASNVYGFSVSEDESRVLWWTPREIWVLWLTDVSYQPAKSAGNRELIAKSTSQIKRAEWFRSPNHIVLEANGYKIAEIDTRGEVNVIKL